jgi:hypothetical protein
LLEIAATSAFDVGTYEIVITAMLPLVNGPISTSTSFSLTILHDCLLTSLIDSPYLVMQTSVSNPSGPVDQDLFIIDSKADLYGPDLYCGPRTYTLSPWPAFLTMAGDLVSVQTDLTTDAAMHTF